MYHLWSCGEIELRDVSTEAAVSQILRREVVRRNCVCVCGGGGGSRSRTSIKFDDLSSVTELRSKHALLEKHKHLREICTYKTYIFMKSLIAKLDLRP